MDVEKIITIMAVCGIFGGIVNFFLIDQSVETFNVRYLIAKSIFLGVAASFLVPLFLKTIGSDILEVDDKTKEIPPLNYFVLSGFCLLAAILSKRFIEDLYGKLLKLEKETKAELKEAKDDAKAAKADAKEAKLTAQDIGTEPDDIVNPQSSLSNFSFQQDIKSNAAELISAMQNSHYAFRTRKGLQSDSSLTPEELQTALDQLIEKNIISTRIGKSGTKVYKLNDSDEWLSEPDQIL